MTILTPTSPNRLLVDRRSRQLLQILMVLGCSICALATVYLIEGHQGKSIEVIPVGVVAAVGLVSLAFTDFTVFVIAVLGIRAALDWSKSAPTHVGGAGASSGLAGGGVALLFLAGSFTWFLSRRRYLNAHPEMAKWRSDLGPALLLFVATGALSVLGSARISTSAIELLRIASAVTMLLVLERLMVSRRIVKLVIGAGICASVVPGIVAATQFATGGGRFTSGGYSRIRGTFVHPNPFSIFLTFTIVMSCAMFFQTPRRVRPWLGALILGNSFALILTYTRTGWVATAIGIFLMCAVNKKLKLFFIGSAVALLVISPLIIGRLENLGQLHRANGTSGNSLIWRVGYWTQILPLANHNPITGIGLKMTQFNAIEQKEPHNDFIRAYVETGIFGFITYVGVQVAMWRTALRALRATAGRGGFDRAVASGFLAVAAAFTLISLVSNIISSDVLLWYVFAYAAAAGVIARMPPEAPEGRDLILTGATGAIAP